MGFRMNARIALFGTSRSGKDYTIRDAIEILADDGKNFSHISPIGMVHEKLYGRKLRNMPDVDKRELVSEVRKEIESLLLNDSVFVDEHYCFPEIFGGVKIDNGYYGEKLPYHTEIGLYGRAYEVVFEDEWLKNYDMIVYMDIDPVVILDRFRSSVEDKQNLMATYEDVRLWQMHEMDRIRELCHSYEIPLYYIYNHRKSGEELATVTSRFLKSKVTRYY